MYIKMLLTAIMLMSVAAHGAASLQSSLTFRGSMPIRYLGIFEVYTIHLYTMPGATRENLLSADQSRCIRLEYAMGLTVENFVEAAEQLMSEQQSPETISAVRAEIDLLHTQYKPVEEGDSYLLCYSGDTGATRLELNGVSLVDITSSEFAKIYFGIWLDAEQGIARDLLMALDG